MNQKSSARKSDHRFYLAMACVSAVLVVVGFWPSYFQPLLTSGYTGSTVFKIHAVVFLGWIMLFLTQGVLVSSNNSKIHKKVGLFGMGLGVLMILLGVAVSILRVQRLVESGRIDSLFGGIWLGSEPFVDIIQFSVLLYWGYSKRKDPVSHKRIMLLTVISILPAATARMGYLIGPWSMEILFFCFAGLILLHDWRNYGKIFRVNWIGLLILLPRALLAMSFKM